MGGSWRGARDEGQEGCHQPPFPAHLELQLHAGDVLAGLHLCQLLDVGIEAAGGHLGVAAAHGLQQRLVDEAVLVLRLHHVVALRAHERHMAVHVHRLLGLDALQHGIDDNEAAGAAHAGTVGGEGRKGEPGRAGQAWPGRCGGPGQWAEGVWSTCSRCGQCVVRVAKTVWMVSWACPGCSGPGLDQAGEIVLAVVGEVREL